MQVHPWKWMRGMTGKQKGETHGHKMGTSPQKISSVPCQLLFQLPNSSDRRWEHEICVFSSGWKQSLLFTSWRWSTFPVSFLWPRTASVPSRTMRETSKLIRCSEMPRTEWSNWAKFPSCTIWKPKIFLERFLSKQLQIKSRLLDSNHLLSSRTAKNWWHLLQRAISVLASASTCSRISQSVADQPRAFKYLQPRRAHN